MILLLDTSSSACILRLLDDNFDEEYSWDAGRELSKGILGYLHDKLGALGRSWSDVAGIVLYRGPGSFTGLRIGHTVCNTIAHAQSIPIVGEAGESWQVRGLARLEAGEDDKLVMPLYGAAPNITKARK